VKIACAIDGSEFSHWAVEALGALECHPPDTVYLLHVVDTPAIKASGGNNPATWKRALAAMDKAGAESLRSLAQAAATALSQAVTGPRTKVRTTLAHGPVAQTVVKHADRHRADLMIVGSRGLSDVRGFLLGSVSRKVMSLASHPLLVVKRPLRELRDVLLAVDGSRHSRAAAEFLRDRLLPESARVTVLSVAEPIVTELAAQVVSKAQLDQLTQPIRDKANRIVTEFREMFMKEGCTVSTEVLTGHPSHMILQHLEANRSDLLVVGSRGLTGSERFQLGSVSETLLKYAPCSVLVVRGWHA